MTVPSNVATTGTMLALPNVALRSKGMSTQPVALGTVGSHWMVVSHSRGPGLMSGMERL